MKNSTGKLAGKTAIITGGGTGIGRAIAALFLSEGAFVAICGRRRGVLEETAGELMAEYFPGAGESREPGNPQHSPGVFFDTMDVTNPDDTRAFVEAVVQRTGGVDILVNNAGIMRFSSVEETDAEELQNLMDTNVVGPLRMMQAVLPSMTARGGGAIITLSSIAGHKALPGAGGYCTSKAAVTMISQVAALEWASRGIRVNVIAPGIVEGTELADPIFGPEGVPEFYSKLRSLHPLGRSGVPLDVARTALFLATEESDWMTGVMIPLDGGRHLATNRPPL